MAVPLRSLDPDARDRLAALAPRVAISALAREQVVPVLPALAGALPEGIPRGSVVECGGASAMSSALLVVAEATRQGAWLGVVALPALGLAAAREMGVALERTVLVRDLDQLDQSQRGQVLGAVIDGFDVVLLGGAAQIRTGTARQLQARLRSRGAVLVVVGGVGSFSGDLRVVTRATWSGLGAGHGSLRSRRIEVTVDGRRGGRPRLATVWAPDSAGAFVPDDAVVAPLPVTPVPPVTPVTSVWSRTG